MRWQSKGLISLVSVALLASCFPDPPERAADATEDTALPDTVADTARPDTEVAETADDTSPDTTPVGDTAAPDVEEDTRVEDVADASEDATSGPCAVASGPCDDGNPCTDDDQCVAVGRCEGKARSCDDGEVCTDDFCDGATGACRHVGRAGEPCDDGLQCTSDDACDAAGACVGTPIPCDDDDPCTVDACVEDTVTCAGFKPFRGVLRSLLGVDVIYGVAGRATRVSGEGLLLTGALRTASASHRAAMTWVVDARAVVAPWTWGLYTSIPDNSEYTDVAYADGVAALIGVRGASAPNTPFITMGGLQERPLTPLELPPDVYDLRAITALADASFLAVGNRTVTVGKPGPVALIHLATAGGVPTVVGVGEASNGAIDVVAAPHSGAYVLASELQGRGMLVFGVDDTLVETIVIQGARADWGRPAAFALHGTDVVIVGEAGSVPYTPSGDVRLTTFDSEGSILHDTVMSRTEPLTPLEVTTSSNRIAVVGSRGHLPWIAVTDLTGALIWEDTFSEEETHGELRGVLPEVAGTWFVSGTVSSNVNGPVYPVFARYTANGAANLCP